MGDDIFIKKIKDVFNLCEKYHSPRFSKFLDEKEQAELLKNGIYEGVLFGGYEDAERKILGVFPDWQAPSFDEFPIKALHIIKKYDKELTHRNYLGTILSLGIERNKIGDILVTDSGAYVFAAKDIAEFLKENITKISHCGVETKICSLGEVEVPKKRYELLDIVAGSLRLDAVIASVLKISRSDAKSYIVSGKAMVNHIDTMVCDAILKEGDLLSLRGYGRAEIFEVGNRTRSDRIHITIKKFL